ncbi:ubiquitin ligase (cullin) of SCF [Cryptotrichosporon argae]
MVVGTASHTKFVEPNVKAKPPKDADLKTVWAFISVGVDHIMKRMQTDGMSFAYYILLYTCIYDYCTNPTKASAGMFKATPARGASLQGSDLYGSLQKYLDEHVKRMREEGERLGDTELLKYYAREWDRYTVGAEFLNKLFNYLNKHWVKREKDEGRKDVYNVYTLALVSWKRNFFDSIQKRKDEASRLTQAVLRQIEQQRNGEEIDTSLLKKVIESYVSLGIDESTDQHRQNLEVYQECFQVHFLAATERYYEAESSAFIAGNSVSDYMKKAEDRLEEETRRVDAYLHDSTRKDLKERCELVLISNHRHTLWDEFKALLDGDRESDLARMYGLLIRVSGGLEPLRNIFEGHVKAAGHAAVERAMRSAASDGGKQDAIDPKTYIEALLSTHAKFSDVVNKPFRGELGFNASLDKACREFCNSNAACQKPTQSPALLANYCDQLLKKSNRDLDPEALESALDRALVIFQFIDDKDVFQKFYVKNLAQRLVREVSASDDSESSMISKLKEIAGFDFTHNMTRMIQDISVSRDVSERFKERERRDGLNDGVDFSVMVLGSNFWPLTPPKTDFAIPSQLQSKFKSFTTFYGEVHSGRKLQWLWNVSKSELRSSYLSQKYTFMVSAYQAAILTQFNNDDMLEYKDIQAGTTISDDVLKPQLNLLVKAKVINQAEDSYSLNTSFKSKTIRVQLNKTVKSEAKQETTEVLASVDEDRKFVYQATIVRIMKTRKTIKHQSLIQETTAAISTKFTPKVSDIKKAIDYLIDKEYLERGEEKDSYNYLA